MDTQKFINKHTRKLEKEIDEGFADFEEPSDISLTATDAYTYGEMGFRKGYKKATKKTLKKQKNNKRSTISSYKKKK